MHGRYARGLFLAGVVLLVVTEVDAEGAPAPPTVADAPSHWVVGVASSPGADAPWFVDEVDAGHNSGEWPWVAIDPSTGATMVSYYDADDGDLQFARYVDSGGNCGPGVAWLCETVDSEGDVGKYSSIATIPPGVGISYYDATNRNLKYAYCADVTACNWSVYTVDVGLKHLWPEASTGLYTSLTHGWTGAPYIAYHQGDYLNALMVAHFVGGGGNCGYGAAIDAWQCDTIQTGEGVGQFPSLARDWAGSMHVAYYDAAGGDLWYATNSSGSNCGPGNSWTCYPVTGGSTDAGQYASLYVDSEEHFHIAYYDATNDVLKYAVDVGSGGNCGLFGSAQCDEIDSMMQGYNHMGISIAKDAAGYPIIAYESQYGSLNLARPLIALGLPPGSGNCGPESPFVTWYCETIDPPGKWVSYRNGDYISIAVNSSGLATIAYQRYYLSAGTGNLMVAYQRFQFFLPMVLKNP